VKNATPCAELPLLEKLSRTESRLVEIGREIAAGPPRLDFDEHDRAMRHIEAQVGNIRAALDRKAPKQYAAFAEIWGAATPIERAGMAAMVAARAP
jgi:hypothetical protein